MPFLARRTNPAGPAADALVRGIARRAPHVYGQRWLPPVQLFRGLLPWFTRPAGRDMPEIEARWLAAGARTDPVGAGGAADIAARARSAARAPSGTARSQRS